jgi:hypothetical protein
MGLVVGRLFEDVRRVEQRFAGGAVAPHPPD